jgi:hypothetical protein
VGLASRGARNLDHGVVPIDDPQELAAVRRQARRVHVRSAIVAVVLTVAALVL